VTRNFLSLFLSIVCLVGVSKASAADNLDELSTLLARDLAIYVRVLTRDVNVYHYYKRASNPQYLSTTAIEFSDHYDRAIQNYYSDSKRQLAVAGPGLYAAIDPVASIGYGNFMLEITLKKGAKILAKPYGPISISGELVKAKPNLFNSKMYFSDLTNVEPSELRQITKLAFHKLGVIAYAYSYASHVPNDLCKNAPYIAFVVFGRRSSQKVSIKGFTETWPSLTNLRELLEYQRIDQFRAASVYINDTYWWLWRKRYWRSHIFGCDDLYAEDLLAN
jgi:hypothetical protein